jgi:hypothetical protein
MLNRLAEREGVNRFYFSLQVLNLDGLAEDRGIERFFIQEVDRDRVVIAGDPDGLPGVRAPAPELLPGEMRPRTRELLVEVHERLEVVRLSLGANIGTRRSAWPITRHSTQLARRSERRTGTHGPTAAHGPSSTRPSCGPVASESRAAAAVQEQRENADYQPVRFSPDEAHAIFETCERFLAAVEAMVGA